MNSSISDVAKLCIDENISISRSDNTFGAADWAVFGSILSCSAIIGVFWAWRDRNKSTEEYMLGGGNVNFVPISMSLATTFFSAIAVLGIPAEFYIYGTMYTYFLVPYLICTILSAEVFGPIYMDMGLTSTYEYLEV